MSDTHQREERSSSGGGEDDGKNRRRGFVRYKRHFTRVAHKVLGPFKKAKKHLSWPRPRDRDIIGIHPTPTPTHHSNKKKRWVCLCSAETPTLDSQTIADDPNNPELFAYDTLKALIEKNDFYSRECNPHI